MYFQILSEDFAFDETNGNVIHAMQEELMQEREAEDGRPRFHRKTDVENLKEALDKTLYKQPSPPRGMCFIQNYIQFCTSYFVNVILGLGNNNSCSMSSKLDSRL